MVDKPKALILTVLLDDSGSMNEMKGATVESMNSYLNSVQRDAAAAGREVRVTFLKFSTLPNKATIRTVADNMHIGEVPRLTQDNYQPDGGTPLIDAGMEAINRTMVALATRDDKPNVLVIFQTDGEENTSRKYKREQLAERIVDMKARNWAFVFLGCDLDAYKQADMLGIDRRSTMSYARGATGMAMGAMAANTAAYAATGDASATVFTNSQRKDAGDRHVPADLTDTATKASIGDTVSDIIDNLTD